MKKFKITFYVPHTLRYLDNDSFYGGIELYANDEFRVRKVFRTMFEEGIEICSVEEIV